MSIGERIVALRTARKMSQSDLAEALDVSRQSISKWETDSSVPELEKLVALCEIFGVSMDMLVRGIGESEEHAESSAPAPETEPPRPRTETAPPREVIHVVKFETRKIAGILLFICAAVCVVTCTLLGDLVAGFLLALPFIICGIICCTCKKRAGLWCAWTVYLLTQIFIRVATGIHTYYLIAFFKGEMELTINAIMAFAELMLTLLLVFFTVWSFRKEPLRIPEGKGKFILAGWILLAAARFALGFVSPMVTTRTFYWIFTVVKDWILYIALNVLAVLTYHWWRGHGSCKDDQEKI